MQWRSAGVLIRYSRLNRDAMVMPSYAVLASFATELYLKTVFYIETNGKSTDLREHSLAGIYRKLSQESRDAIRDYFVTLIPRYVNSGGDPTEGAVTVLDAGVLTTDFDAALRMTSDAFLSFRYWYQKGASVVYPSAAEVLRHAANRRIIDLVPGLKGDQRSMSLVAGVGPTEAQVTDLSTYESRGFCVRQMPYEAAYFAAEGNWKAAEVLYRQLHGGAGFVFYSYAMLAALAVELYLKSLVHIEDKTRGTTGKRRFKTKSLSELYEMLSTENRMAIRQNFDTLSRRFAPRLVSDMVPEDVGSLARDKVISYDLDGTLAWMSESFADFRYAFERLHCLVVLPTDQTLRNAVRKCILDLAPELERLET